MITDNGPEFASQEFNNFAKAWKFEHRTSSPHHPQSNGKAENAVKTCKMLLMKAKKDKKDPLLAILDRRNTPTEGLNTSLVQRLMGGCTGTLLPTTEKLLKPAEDPNTQTSLTTQKRLQCEQFNRGTKNLPPMQVGDAVRMKLPGDRKWTLDRCTRNLGLCSYEVEINRRRYRRNRRELRSTPRELPPLTNKLEKETTTYSKQQCLPVVPELITDREEDPPPILGPTSLQCPKLSTDREYPPPILGPTSPQCPNTDELTESARDDPESEQVILPRRSARTRRPPAWHEDYTLYWTLNM